MTVPWSQPLPYTCYELGHCWTTSCWDASAPVFWYSLKYSLKIYGTLYLLMAIVRRKKKNFYIKSVIPGIVRSALFLSVNGTMFLASHCIIRCRHRNSDINISKLAAVVRRKKTTYYVTKLLPETVRSAAFLSTNVGLFICSFCVWRKIFPCYFFYNTFVVALPVCSLSYHIERRSRNLLGQVYFPSAAFLPGFCSSLAAILLERKGRRGMLALYLLNLAVETAFKMAVSRGIVRSINHGEVLLFSSVISIYVYLYNSVISIYVYLYKKNALQENIKKLLSFFVGVSELSPGSIPPSLTGTGPTVTGDMSLTATPGDVVTQPTTAAGAGKRSSSLVSYLPKNVAAFISLWRRGPKHRLCQHRHSCHASTIESGVRLFVIGYCVQAVMKLLRSLTSALRRPRALLDALTHSDNAKLGLFIGSFSGLLRASHCLLRWLRDKDSPIHGAVSGFIAGGSMMFYKSSSIAMWLTSKLAEILYFKGVDAGFLPFLKNGDVLVYTLATAFVLHAAVFEPHNMRPAYWKFLLGLTDQKFALMNRKLIDVYGTNASKMYPNYWPNYDKRFTNL